MCVCIFYSVPSIGSMLGLPMSCLGTHNYTLIIFQTQAIEFFFFAALIFVVTIIFGIMAFFYKYVDLTGQGNGTLNGNSPYVGAKPQDERSPLIVNSDGGLGGPIQNYAST